MQRMFQWILLTLLCFLSAACMTQNLNEGIASFKVQDYRQAFVRLLPEAKKGQPDAQYAIGYMYYYGQGVTENRKEAWKWINLAASVGQKDAVIAVTILSEGQQKP